MMKSISASKKIHLYNILFQQSIAETEYKKTYHGTLVIFIIQGNELHRFKVLVIIGQKVRSDFLKHCI